MFLRVPEQILGTLRVATHNGQDCRYKDLFMMSWFEIFWKTEGRKTKGLGKTFINPDGFAKFEDNVCEYPFVWTIS